MNYEERHNKAKEATKARATHQPPTLGGELKCWSCKAIFSLKDRQKCDGCCWKCGVEIELDDYVAPLLAEIERLTDNVRWKAVADEQRQIIEGLKAERDTLKARGLAGPDEIHQMAFEEGQPSENGDGYLFSAEEFDLFIERLIAHQSAPAAKDGAQ